VIPDLQRFQVLDQIALLFRGERLRSAELMMRNYNYLIVGGGMTAAAAVAGIHEIDRTGTIGLIGAEPHPSYDRPPLSKALWKGDPLESIWRNVERQGVTSHPGRIVQGLDANDRHVVDDHGVSYRYGELLLAIGCTPRRLPFGDGKIIYFRTIDDWQRVHAVLGASASRSWAAVSSPPSSLPHWPTIISKL